MLALPLRDVLGPVDLLPAQIGRDAQRADAAAFGDAADETVASRVSGLSLVAAPALMLAAV